MLSFAVATLGAPPRLAAAHRLDRETSGVLLASADTQELTALGAAFASGGVSKTYLALVHGRCHKKGIIRRPLPDRRRGKPVAAVTRYRAMAWLGPFTLVRARPAHGRKHQIRRHLHGIGHPIVGDKRYHARQTRPVPDAPERLWLHAHSLTLPDGRSFESPLPPALATHLSLLEGSAG